MHGVLLDGLRKQLAQRPFLRIGRVGRTHQLAQVGNGVLFFKNHGEDGARRHKLRQRSKERSCRVNVVETFRLLLGKVHLLDGDELEAGFLHLGENGSGEALANGVGLDDAEGTL